MRRTALLLAVASGAGLALRLAIAPLHPLAVGSVVVCLLSFSFAPVLLRWPAQSAKAASAVVIAFFALEVIATYFEGGLDAPLLVAAPLVALVATVLLGLKAGVRVTIALAIYFFVLAGLHAAGHGFHQVPLGDEQLALARGVFALVVGIVMVVLASVLENERRRWRATVQESEALSHVFIQKSPIAMYVATPEGELLEFNASFCDLFGIVETESLGSIRLEELWMDVDDRRKIVSRLRWGELIAGVEIRLRRLDGQEVWGLLHERMFVDRHGRVVYEGSIVDVTEPHRVSAELEERERHHRFVVDSSLGFMWTNDEVGLITSINEQGAQMLGWSREELLQRNLREILDDRSREILEGFRADLVDRGEVSGLMTAVTRSGVRRTIQVRLLRVDRPDGRTVFLGHGQDVTEHLMAERDLEQRETALAELSAIASSGSMKLRDRAEALLDLACRRLPADAAVLFRQREEGPVSTVARPPGSAVDTPAVLPPQLWPEALREPISIGDVSRSAWSGHAELATIGALTTAPVIVWGEPYGVLLVARTRDRARPFRKGQTELVRLMSLWLGATLEQEGRIEEAEELSRLGHLLAGCSNEEEAFEVTARSLPRLFPDASGGTVFQVHPVDRTLTVTVNWGHPLTTVDVGQELGRDACWALRTGREYVVERAGEDRVTCEHVQHGPPMSFLCLPLRVGEEIKGVFHMQAAMGSSVSMAARLLADRVAELLSLSVWNLELREQLRQQSIRDGLTEVFNRRYFDVALDRECRRALRSGEPTSAVMFDLDAFKAYNDSLGHQEGDRCLQEVAKATQGCLRRSSDLLARYGGEEFVVILPGAPAEQSLALAEALRRVVEGLQLRHPASPHEVVTISVGVATAEGEHLRNPGELIERADRALYRAKQAGRNSVRRG